MLSSLALLLQFLKGRDKEKCYVLVFLLQQEEKVKAINNCSFTCQLFLTQLLDNFSFRQEHFEFFPKNLLMISLGKVTEIRVEGVNG